MAAIDALLAYAERVGILVDECVRVTHTPDEGYSLMAEKRLEDGQAVLRLPLGSTLSLANNFPVELAELLSPLDPTHALALLLCVTPDLEAWTGSWPTQAQGSWGLRHTPEWEALVVWYHELSDRHAECSASAAAAFDNTIQPFFAEHSPLVPVTYARFSWAVSMVDSRAARVNLFGQERLVLMPLVDLLNHRAVPCCSLGFEPDAGEAGQLVVRTKRAVEAGEPLTISYGRKGNDEMLASYGFALACNPYDRAVIPLALSGGAALTMQKAAMLPRGTTRTTPTGDTQALLSFGWAQPAADGSPAEEPMCAEVKLPAEAWLVLRVATAMDVGDMLAALSAGEEEESSTRSGWELLRSACEAQLAALPSEAAETEPVDGASGASAAAALAAAGARRRLLKAAVAAARTACDA
jgi:hypothetical protein